MFYCMFYFTCDRSYSLLALFRDSSLPRGDNTGEEIQRAAAVQQNVQRRISKTGLV